MFKPHIQSLFMTLLVTLVTLAFAQEAIQEYEQGLKSFIPEIFSKELKLSLNSGCNFKNCTYLTNMTLANLTISDGPTSHLDHRWIWAVIDRPAVQAALTHPQDELDIDWTALLGAKNLESSIAFSEDPTYSVSVMIANLIEYNDIHKVGYFDPEHQDYIVYPMNNFVWNRTCLENTTERVAFELIGNSYLDNRGQFNITEGKVNLTLSAYGIHGFGRWLPHLSHSESTNQVDIQLEHLKTTSNFTFSRYALELYLVSDASKNTKLFRQSTKTLDDEHTPGIFITHELIVPGHNDTLQAYLQWRPVVYTTMERDLSSSTGVKISKDIRIEKPSKTLNNTILYAFYGLDLDKKLVRKINVSIGSVGDGFYNKTQYYAWTFTLGTGEPIHNGLSSMVIMVVTVMFGIMILVLLTSAIICGCKKLRRNSTPEIPETSAATSGSDVRYQRLEATD